MAFSLLTNLVGISVLAHNVDQAQATHIIYIVIFWVQRNIGIQLAQQLRRPQCKQTLP